MFAGRWGQSSHSEAAQHLNYPSTVSFSKNTQKGPSQVNYGKKVKKVQFLEEDWGDKTYSESILSKPEEDWDILSPEDQEKQEEFEQANLALKFHRERNKRLRPLIFTGPSRYFKHTQILTKPPGFAPPKQGKGRGNFLKGQIAQIEQKGEPTPRFYTSDADPDLWVTHRTIGTQTTLW